MIFSRHSKNRNKLVIFNFLSTIEFPLLLEKHFSYHYELSREANELLFSLGLINQRWISQFFCCVRDKFNCFRAADPLKGIARAAENKARIYWHWGSNVNTDHFFSFALSLFLLSSPFGVWCGQRAPTRRAVCFRCIHGQPDAISITIYTGHRDRGKPAALNKRISALSICFFALSAGVNPIISAYMMAACRKAISWRYPNFFFCIDCWWLNVFLMRPEDRVLETSHLFHNNLLPNLYSVLLS